VMVLMLNIILLDKKKLFDNKELENL
jgi:hypothetical protein